MNGNSLELLVRLGVNQGESKANIDAEIQKLQDKLKDVKVDLQFDKEALKSLKEISNIDFSKLMKSVNEIKTDLKGIQEEAKVTARITEDQFKDAGADIEKAFGHLGNNFKKVTKKGISDISELKQAFKGLDATFNLDYKMLKNDGADTAKRQIDAVTVSYKNLQGQMEKMKMSRINIDDGDGLRTAFVPNLDGKAVDKSMAQIAKLGESTQKTLNEMRQNGKLTEAQFADLSNAIGKVGTVNGFSLLNQRITETANAQKLLTDGVKAGQAAQEKNTRTMVTSAESATQKITKLRAEGKLTEAQFAELAERIGSIGHKNGYSLLNQRIDETVNKQKQIVAEEKKIQAEQVKVANNELKRKNLIADIERSLQNQAKTINQLSANKLLSDVKNLDVNAKNFDQSLRASQSSFKHLNREANDLARQNVGIVDSFKQAMEKFPIWMAASTMFYGVIRTAREFGTIIVDIDSKMVGLTKVMSDDTDFGAVFDRATESAENFGQSISAALDSYNEFAKQGYKAEELGMLADSGLVAANVGEMTAQQASEYMTASLIQWKKDASESMGIIDSWNEISNNYATTTEKLAAGQARAGSTARAMGLDFDQLNAIVGTVSHVAV